MKHVFAGNIGRKKKTKFTPGPWRFVEEDIGINTGEYEEPQVKAEPEADGFERTIAIVRIGLSGSQGNGNLIAAAPDLYEALEEALADIRCYYGSTYISQHAKSEAALKKARGEV